MHAYKTDLSTADHISLQWMCLLGEDVQARLRPTVGATPLGMVILNSS